MNKETIKVIAITVLALSIVGFSFYSIGKDAGYINGYIECTASSVN